MFLQQKEDSYYSLLVINAVNLNFPYASFSCQHAPC